MSYYSCRSSVNLKYLWKKKRKQNLMAHPHPQPLKKNFSTLSSWKPLSVQPPALCRTPWLLCTEPFLQFQPLHCVLVWLPTAPSFGCLRLCLWASAALSTCSWKCQGISLLSSLKVKVTQSCLTLCNPMDCSPPGSSVHGILQAKVLEWVAILFSRGSSQPGDWTQVSCTVGRFFTIWATKFFPEINPQTVIDKSWWINTPVSSPFRWDWGMPWKAEACPEWLRRALNGSLNLPTGLNLVQPLYWFSSLPWLTPLSMFPGITSLMNLFVLKSFPLNRLLRNIKTVSITALYFIDFIAVLTIWNHLVHLVIYLQCLRQCSLEGLMLKLKRQYFGHVMSSAASLEKTLVLRKDSG